MATLLLAFSTTSHVSTSLDSGINDNKVARTAQGADWTVLFSDDFEDGKADGWEVIVAEGPSAGWKVEREGTNYVFSGRGHSLVRLKEGGWSDYRFKAKVKLIEGSLHLNYRLSGCIRYFIGFNNGGLYLSRTLPCGTHTDLRRSSAYHAFGQWYTIEILGVGANIKIYIDGVLKIDYTDANPVLFGTIGLEALPGSRVLVDDVQVIGPRPPGPPEGLTWVKTGGPLGGLGYDVRMHPDNPDVMYVTDAWSGVNMSTDGGRTWIASNEGITTRTGPSGDAIPIFSLTIDPHNPNIIWAGTQGIRGIFKSVDGGRTWVEKVNGIIEREGITFRGFTVDPRDSNIVYAAAEISSFVWAGEPRIGREFDLTKGVVYKTTDGGEHWTAIWRGDNLARYVWIDPRNPNVLYVSTGIFDREAANSDARTNTPGGVGIIKSTDGGRTWRALNAASGLKNLYIGTLFMHPQNSDILLAGAGNNAYREGSGVYLSTDGGETWTQALTTGSEPITSVEFSLSDPNAAYAGSPSAIYHSTDGGRTWQRVTTGRIWGPLGIRAGFPIDFQVNPRDPNRLFANNYGGGNFLSEDGGRTWVVASRGYTGAQLHDLAVYPTDPRRVYVIGRTGPFRSLDGGTNWEGLNFEPATFGEWYAVALDPQSPQNVLISDEHQGVLLLSTDGGLHWQIVFRHPQVDASDFRRRHGFKAIAFAPSDPRVVYAGMSRERRNIDEGRADPSFGIYKSTDGGLTWREANDTNTKTQNINDIAVDPRDANVAYAATVKSGMFKTTDGGKSWRAINAGLAVLDIRALSIDPQNPQTLYAGAEGGGVYKSTDGGTRWVSISAGMDPQAAIRSIVIDPTNSQVVYAADLRTGVYRSEDGGKMWVRINDGLRTRAVKALAISTDGKVLYAATEGEGVFRLNLPL